MARYELILKQDGTILLKIIYSTPQILMEGMKIPKSYQSAKKSEVWRVDKAKFEVYRTNTSTHDVIIKATSIIHSIEC